MRLAEEDACGPLLHPSQTRNNLRDHAFGVGFNFAFPHSYDAPACRSQRRRIPFVPFNRSFKLALPEITARCGRGGVSASRMPVPEAAVNLDY
jgi:hypothetical protein